MIGARGRVRNRRIAGGIAGIAVAVAGLLIGLRRSHQRSARPCLPNAGTFGVLVSRRARMGPRRTRQDAA